jgi:hypothetical protein
MCFSANASFAVAATTGVVGILSIAHVSRPSELPLAAMPLLFAMQQTTEGLLWAGLMREVQPDWIAALATIFAVIALVIWPVWTPAAVSLAEADPARRRKIAILLGLGVAVGLYGAVHVAAAPYSVSPVRHTLSYANGVAYSPVVFAVYAASIVGSLFLSSYRPIRIFGWAVVAGLIVSALFYALAFFSVWCFFAAAGSVLIYLHFAHVPFGGTAKISGRNRSRRHHPGTRL